MRDEMKPTRGNGLDPLVASPAASQLVSTDGPTMIPFVRRNLFLKLLELDPHGNSTPRVATRNEVLKEIRQNWDPGHDTGKHRLPRRHRSVREGSHEEIFERVRKMKNERGRNGRDKRGTAVGSAPFNRKKDQRGGGNRLSVRDMRQIDPAFTPKPAIWVREDAIVVSLEDVRAIILHNKMLVFDADNSAVRTPIRFIRKRLINNMEDAFMPFEFRALEGILIYVCSILEKAFLDIDPFLKRTLCNLPKRIDIMPLEELRRLEQQLNNYYSRARKVQNALQSVLDEDEDMADLYLTEKRRNPGVHRNPLDHDEAEMLLEAYLQNIDDLTIQAALLNQTIDDTENLIEIHLDTTQNRLLLVHLIITAFSTVISFGAMVTALFGMNFPPPEALESLPGSQYYFYGCLLVVGLVMSTAIVFLVRWCRHEGIYRGRPHVRRKKDGVFGASARAFEQTRKRAEKLLSTPDGLERRNGRGV